MPQQTARLPGYWMPVFAGMTSELLPGESPPAYSRRALNQVEADGDSTRGVLVRVSLKLDALLQLAAAHGGKPRNPCSFRRYPRRRTLPTCQNGPTHSSPRWSEPRLCKSSLH